MAPTTAIRPAHSTIAYSEAGPASVAVDVVEAAAPPVETESTATSTMANFVPDGGLHPVVHGPRSELFGFITQALHAATSKQEPQGGSGGEDYCNPLGGCFPANGRKMSGGRAVVNPFMEPASTQSTAAQSAGEAAARGAAEATASGGKVHMHDITLTKISDSSSNTPL